MEKIKLAMTEAQLRAQDKYKKKALVNVALQFNKFTEPELVEYVTSLPNKTAYIKGLLREQMGVGATHYVLRINDEDEQREYRLHAHTAEDALSEAEQIIGLFSGWLKGRIDRAGWCIEDEQGNKTYLFRAE